MRGRVHLRQVAHSSATALARIRLAPFSLRVSVSSPGRDHGTWQFEVPDYDEYPSFQLSRGGSQISSLQMSVLPGIEIPEEYPPCPGLRGQPCRVYEARENTIAE